MFDQNANASPLSAMPEPIEQTSWLDLLSTEADLKLAMEQPRAFRRGEQLDICVAIVVSGVLSGMRNQADGRRLLVALHKHGDYLDLRRLRRRRQSELLALSSGSLVPLHEGMIDAIIGTNHTIATAVMNSLREQTGRLRDHCADINRTTPRERVASILMEFRGWRDAAVTTGRNDLIKLPVRWIDVADYLGIKPETVSRCVRTLQNEAVIEVHPSNVIRILDVPGLRTAANGGRPRRSTKRQSDETAMNTVQT